LLLAAERLALAVGGNRAILAAVQTNTRIGINVFMQARTANPLHAVLGGIIERGNNSLENLRSFIQGVLIVHAMTTESNLSDFCLQQF
jgi:hypothetical protein